MSGSSSTDLVPNPMHQALSKLYAQLQQDADTMKKDRKSVV